MRLIRNSILILFIPAIWLYLVYILRDKKRKN